MAKKSSIASDSPTGEGASRFRFNETISPELSREKLTAELEDLTQRTFERVHSNSIAGLPAPNIEPPPRLVRFLTSVLHFKLPIR